MLILAYGLLQWFKELNMSDILLHNAIAKGTRDMRVNLLGAPTELAPLLNNPNCYPIWASLPPKIPTPAGNLCVYDAGAFFRGGGTCTWTVPAGITKARFELWGAGAGSQGGNCCSHGPIGNSGSYASVCMTVTPGTAYVLCAGAASTVVSCCEVSCDISGCPSYVTGPGLTNFCALGGCANLLYTMCQIGNVTAVANNRYAGHGYGWGSTGVQICGDGFGAMRNTNTRTFGVLRRDFLRATSFFGTATNATVYGLKSQNAAMMAQYDMYGCVCTYSLPLPSGAMSPIVCESFSSGTCQGSRCAACLGYALIPGHGGWWTNIQGGSTNGTGDWGRTGMVKVSWA